MTPVSVDERWVVWTGAAPAASTSSVVRNRTLRVIAVLSTVERDETR
jgi:hypothetical protein